MKYFKLYASLSEREIATGIRIAHQHGLRAVAHLDRVSWSHAARQGIIWLAIRYSRRKTIELRRLVDIRDQLRE